MRNFALFLCSGLFIFFVSSAAQAAFESQAREAILVDYQTGTVLYEKNADQRMVPSSMTKLMTLYLLFERMKEGKLKLEDTLPVSEKAWRMQGSKMFVPLGERITVKSLIEGIAIQSGNDACIVVAEGLGGSEETFAKEMNEAAVRLGLTGSHFMNASGWPDPDHYSTARDLYIIARHLINDFPEYYPFFSEREFTFHNIRQFNRNPLLDANIGVDGLKTGHTEEAGYGVVISGVAPDGRRVISVINGLGSIKQREEAAQRLIEYGYREFENVTLVKKDQPVSEAEVWLGESETVPLVATEDMVMSLPKFADKNIKLQLHYNGPVAAPVEAGAKIAELSIAVPDMPEMRVPLAAGNTVEKKGIFGRMLFSIRHHMGI